MSQSISMSAGNDPSIPYATPAKRLSSPVFAGAAILLGGLGLVALAGCFLVGVLMINTEANLTQVTAAGTSIGLSASQGVLLCVLYVAAFACFGGAVVMLLAGTRALLRILNA